ncbi:LolA family protein [Pseudalkalibacillus caeni]|uniref:Outer membrane lipoprotein carrier protein LolA n=1 Tax=Exobacillus caeni TaxID=2574798 RepID=A0A5R9F507_9BACL|nr:outer membrane lipoprotein carrier protein LolA [Pseudalkalibacillus caeni]TLS34905.1 outer membrane lipoprotein carrier protein LolA [Pseudalkalibacillus caeni]
MKRIGSILLVGLIFMVVLSGCGQKSQEDVMSSIDKKLNELESYRVNAQMTLETGEEPQKYDVEIWYKKPSFYRVKLKNANQEQNQIILRNDEGVFVLTPALNKSFRFQSDWPENGSQAYLYNTLASDILNDSDAGFEAKENDYVFDTKANYQNKNLARQEITLKKKDLAPKQVKILNQDMKVLVTVDFSKMEFNPKFDKDAFDMERNMTAAQLEVPVIAANSAPLEVLYPMYEPQGTGLSEQKEVSDGKVVLSYTGEKSFTLIEEKSETAMETSAPVQVSAGEPVDLGFAVGVMTDNTITWSHNGVDYFLASNDLSKEEMASVARSVYGTTVK